MAPEEALTSSTEKSILIIDDDEEFRKLLQEIVSREGFQTDSAEDGSQGLKKIQAQHPDLIILDLMLPSRGGFDILRQLQASDAAKIPVIVVTGRFSDKAMPDMVRQESNVVDFMQKPVKSDILAAALHRVLKTAKPSA